MKRAPGEHEPEGRFYGPIVAALGCALFTAGVALTILTMASVIGPFRVFESDPQRGDFAIGLWLPPSLDASPGAERARRIRAWRRAFAGAPSLREGRSIEALTRHGVRVVALPDARALSGNEMAELRGFVRDGGGAILTGALAVRDAEGRFSGFDSMASLLEVRRISPRAAATGFLVPAQRGPLSAGLAPGTRLAFGGDAGLPALEEGDAELRWDAAPAVSASPDAPLAGASRRLEWGRGRVVWLAAGPESLAPESAHHIEADERTARLLTAAASWAGREPFLEVLPWPGGARFALVIEPRRAGDLSGVGLSRSSATDLRAGPGVTWASSREAIDRAIARAEQSGGVARIALSNGDSDLARHARRGALGRGAWIARPSELVVWRRQRALLFAAGARVGPQRRLVEISNRGTETVAGSVLRVHLNAPYAAARVARTTLQQEEPVALVDLPGEKLDIEVPELGRGAHRAWTLDLERVDLPDATSRT